MRILSHSLSPEEADQRMESAGEVPFSPEEIDAMVRSAITGGPPPRPGLRLLPRLPFWNGFAALLLASATLPAVTSSLTGRSIPSAPSVQSSASNGIQTHALRVRRNQCRDPFTITQRSQRNTTLPPARHGPTDDQALQTRDP